MPMAPIAVSLAASFVMFACLPIGVDARPRHEEMRIAQANDSDTPPELRQHLRARVRANEDTGAGGLGSGGPAFGERPFRRPRGNQDGGDGNNAAPTRAPDQIPAIAPGQGLRGGGPGVGLGMPAENGALGGFKRGGNRPFGNRPFGGPGNGAPPDGVARFRRGLGAEGPPADGQMQGRFRRQAGAQGPGGGLFGRKPLDFSSLNLTDDQKQRIQQIRSGNGAHAREFSQSLKERRSEMRDLMFDPVASDDQIRSKMRDVRQLQEKMDDVQINDFLAIRKVLTPEQRQKLADLKPGRKVADQPPQADGGPSQQQR
jgi:Spy/CpxP family protein refolding chaperone